MAADLFRIMLVDDEVSQRSFMREVLYSAGFEVIDAADYTQAMSLFRRHRARIDMLIVDVSLPGRNGYELAAVLAALRPGLKVLFISGKAGAELCKFYGTPLEDVHFLEKPFQGIELLNRVRTLREQEGQDSSGSASA